jgi:hypothetical protein
MGPTLWAGLQSSIRITIINITTGPVKSNELKFIERSFSSI